MQNHLYAHEERELQKNNKKKSDNSNFKPSEVHYYSSEANQYLSMHIGGARIVRF